MKFELLSGMPAIVLACGVAAIHAEESCSRDCVDEDDRSSFMQAKVNAWPGSVSRKSSCSDHSNCSTTDFCLLKDEIFNQGDPAGWQLHGTCTPRWDGFCQEDEHCGPRTFCNKSNTLINAGICAPDILCATASNHGSCLAGKYRCNFGFFGSTCTQSKRAFAFLFYGGRAEDLINARVLIQSLRAHGGKDDIIAIVPKFVPGATTSEASLKILADDGVKLVHTDPIAMPEEMAKSPIIMKRWSGVMNKFTVFSFENYTQIALVDIDAVFARKGDPPSSVFDDCNADLCAVRDMDPRFINAGFMVVRPSKIRFLHLVSHLQSERHHFDMPEQSFLTRYAEVPGNRFSLAYLDPKWNSCGKGGIMFEVGWANNGFNLLHSCSWVKKPHDIRLCIPGTCNSGQQRHTVLLWQSYHFQVDTCALQAQEAACGSSTGLCTWCGHYCSDARVQCKQTLFSGTLEGDVTSTTTVSDMEECGDDGQAFWENANAAGTAELPSAWWAWPRVSMYQLVVDRFAISAERPCPALDDYCGGTFKAMKEKLQYVKELGVDGLVISPVVENMPKGYHGYWTKDLNSVNPRFGTEEELKDLIVEAHENGLAVTADVNLNHAGVSGLSKEDTVSQIPHLRPFNTSEHFHSEECYLWTDADWDGGRRKKQNCRLYGMLDYNHENFDVTETLAEWLQQHVRTFGFDSVRIDAAAHMPKSFLRYIGSSDPPIPAFFEDPSGDPHIQIEYVLNHNAFAAIYNYPLYYAIRNVFGSKKEPMYNLANMMDSMETEDRLLLNFIDNNDLPRFSGLLHGDAVLYHNALALLSVAEGVPVLFYGSEQEAESNRGEPENYTPDDWRPPLWQVGYNTSHLTFMMLRRLLWLRHRFDGMHKFERKTVFADHEWLVFSRGPILFVITNIGKSMKVDSQRTFWSNSGNSSISDKSATPWENCTVLLCDLLSSGAASGEKNKQQDCLLKIPGQPLTMSLVNGSPKVYVPRVVLDEYWQDTQRSREKERDKEAKFFPSVFDSRLSINKTEFLSGSQNEPEIIMVPWNQWLDVSRIYDGMHVSLERVPRSKRPVAPLQYLTDYTPAWLSEDHVPQHMDQWFPPLYSTTKWTMHTTFQDACWLGEYPWSGVMRGDFFYCPMKYNCEFTSPSQMRLVYQGSKEIISDGRPTLIQPQTLYLGFYHNLIESLPPMMHFFPLLQAGSMQLLVTNFSAFIGLPQVFEYLRINSSNVVVNPKTADSPGPVRFCSEEIHYYNIYSPDSQHPGGHQLQMLRQALAVPWRPCLEPQIKISLPSVVLLSRGSHGKRSLHNEAELVESLKLLGRPVEVLVPGTDDLEKVISVLACAEVLVGAHGANLANMIFAPSGVKVVEIMPMLPNGNKFVNSHYWTLAGALGFRYSVVGQKLLPNEINASFLPMVQAVQGFSVDVKRIKAQVAALLDTLPGSWPDAVHRSNF